MLQAEPTNQVSSVNIPRSPVSLDSNASTVGPSTATPPLMNAVGGSTTIRAVSDVAVPLEFVRGTTAEALSIEPDEQEAETMLFEYKTNMTEQFPFVIIYPDNTSQSLRNKKPFLWKAIMVAACHENSGRQLALGAKLMEELSTRLLLKAERSLDLLQALLVFSAWYALLFHFAVHTTSIEYPALTALQVPLSYSRQPTTHQSTSFGSEFDQLYGLESHPPSL